VHLLVHLLVRWSVQVLEQLEVLVMLLVILVVVIVVVLLDYVIAMAFVLWDDLDCCYLFETFLPSYFSLSSNQLLLPLPLPYHLSSKL